jgi:hypothetical protein
MTKFLIVVEKTRTGFSAFAPDLPGCVATGATRPRVAAAIARHAPSSSFSSAGPGNTDSTTHST